MTEAQLIEGCKKGDRKSQKKLYDTYAAKMMAVCFRYTGDKEAARDMLQDGFIKVFLNIESYAGIGSFEGWIRRIFINCCLEILRKNDPLRESEDLETTYHLHDVQASVLEEISAKEILGLVSELPAGFRTVFNLFAIEGYSHKEIGEMLEITESTSRSQFTRAKQVLQKRVAELYQSTRT